MKNETQPQHTQGEWICLPNGIIEAPSRIICQMSGDYTGELTKSKITEEDKANAQRIVTAVNEYEALKKKADMHDELISFVSMMRDCLSSNGSINKQSTAFLFGSNKTFLTIAKELLKQSEQK